MNTYCIEYKETVVIQADSKMQAEIRFWNEYHMGNEEHVVGYGDTDVISVEEEEED